MAPAATGQRFSFRDLPSEGEWEPPFQHDLTGFASPARFEAVHMALVPSGAQRGNVLVWDVRGPQLHPAWVQRWSILDVSGDAPVFRNGELTLPEHGGDFFCGGHAWTSRGELLVAGGTTRYFGGILGGRLVYLWDPEPGAMGRWRRQPDMSVDRWYPTVVALSTGEMLIAGGTPGTSQPAWNDYEVFALPPRGPGAYVLTRPRPSYPLFPGPSAPASELDLYPRIHQLASGDQFVSGMGGASARMNHAQNPGQWTFTDGAMVPLRDDNCSLLYPVPPNAPELVMRIGGEGFDANGSIGVLDTVEVCRPAASGPPDWSWIQFPRLTTPRARANAVVLPDRSVLVIGDSTSPAGVPEVALDSPELFDGKSWRTMAPAACSRAYHSTAVLLPDGRVMTGGGDTSKFDYQIFVPPYLIGRHPRPKISSAPALLDYSSVHPAWQTLGIEPLPPGEAVGHVALIAPGSVTHSFDASQRYVELVLGTVTGSAVEFRGPLDANRAPPGYYMLFLVSAAGVPSVARWVEVR